MSIVDTERHSSSLESYTQADASVTASKENSATITQPFKSDEPQHVINASPPRHCGPDTVTWYSNYSQIVLKLGKTHYEQLGVRDGDKMAIFLDPDDDPTSVFIAKVKSGGCKFRKKSLYTGVVTFSRNWDRYGILVPDGEFQYKPERIEFKDDRLVLNLPPGKTSLAYRSVQATAPNDPVDPESKVGEAIRGPEARAIGH